MRTFVNLICQNYNISLYVWVAYTQYKLLFPSEICKIRILYRILLRAIVMPSREVSSDLS